MRLATGFGRALLERVSVLPTNEPVIRDDGLPGAIAMVIEGRARTLGGMPVARVLPERRCRAVGPFVFLDEMGPVTFEDGVGMDVPPHPHIGLATVTYLHEGALVHRDNLGSVQTITPGAVNLMSAGKGIVHSERSPDSERVAGSHLHGLQLWVALPIANEQDAPSFEHHEASSLPAWTEAEASVRLLMGTWQGHRSPVSSPAEPFLIDVVLPSGSRFRVPTDPAERAIYVVTGELRAGGACVLPAGSLAVLVQGQALEIEASVETRFAILGGPTLDAPRLIDWNFVASSRALIDRARDDWRHQRFAKVPGDEREFVPLPR